MTGRGAKEDALEAHFARSAVATSELLQPDDPGVDYDRGPFDLYERPPSFRLVLCLLLIEVLALSAFVWFVVAI